MFKIVDERRAWWPVKWPGVTEDGKVIENAIELQFQLLDTDANVELSVEGVRVDQRVAELSVGLEPLAGAGAEPTVAPAVSEIWADFLLRFTRDWRGVGAANGEALPFSRENLIRLVKVSGVFRAAVAAYRACSAGEAEIRTGN